jgi:outer membrane lipopolysaccharide assembly protein LptE/RlpB
MLGSVLTILSATLLIAAGFNLPQSPAVGQKLQTVRLHIDGFSKSKSGAI